MDIVEERDGELLALRLNRPESMNALAPDLRIALTERVQRLAVEQDARALLITGSGRAFCAGADLTSLLDRRDRVVQSLDDGVNVLIRTLRTLPIPVICAVNGAAAGAGVSLALASDILVAAESAKFHLAFVRIGAAMDAGSSLFLTRTIGAARTRALAMMGGAFDARTGKEWGAVHEVWPDEVFEAEARALGRRLAEGPTRAIGLIKRQINYAEARALDDVLPFEAVAQGQAFAGEDLEIGVTAFLERRPAVFKGR
ncbi:enoyl-CoA hydratase-related protein [uncultured Albimonas sp.]|uniref:enoyl-CoA hydratase-related protein n=1 Tax=uncultured Albimonas sp. TaxID=1331701 RepID=UPI0030EC6024|tara:strand:+ start:1125 stop:1895 length:771 start_codon:yes stop_codon:yes gene_type:complete